LDGALDGHRENVSKTKVFVCRKCKRHACVEDALDHSDGKVVLVRCQKICSGPVAGIAVHGRMEWFDRLDTAKRLAGLRLLADQKRSEPVKSLEKRRVRRRSGRAVR